MRFVFIDLFYYVKGTLKWKIYDGLNLENPGLRRSHLGLFLRKCCLTFRGWQRILSTWSYAVSLSWATYHEQNILSIGKSNLSYQFLHFYSLKRKVKEKGFEIVFPKCFKRGILKMVFSKGFQVFMSPIFSYSLTATPSKLIISPIWHQNVNNK